MANLQKILQFVQDLDSVGVGTNVTQGIAEGMTAAGWDTSAETVASNLEAAINSALVINSPSERMYHRCCQSRPVPLQTLYQRLQLVNPSRRAVSIP